MAVPVDVQADGFTLLPGVADVLRERALRVLSALPPRVSAVRVRLQEAGPDGLYPCYVTVELLPAGGLAVAATAATLYSAFDTALARAEAAVRHDLRVRDGALPDSEEMRAYIRWDGPPVAR